MSDHITIHIGTIGQGLWRSPDGGDVWQKGRGVGEQSIRSLAVFPDDPNRLLAGADDGLFLSDDNGSSWSMVDSYEPDRQTWSLAVDPTDPDIIFAGGRPGVRRSRDGGQSWDDLPVQIVEECPVGIPRTTVVVIDPLNSQRVYAGVEVDGVHKSLDGGDTWVRGNPLGPETFQADIHCMGRSAGLEGSATFATSPFGIARSDDEGESWLQHEFPPLTERTQRSYCRAMIVKHDDPDAMFVASGDGIPGTTGAIQRTTDGGQTWTTCDLPVAPNSVVYWLATHADAPDTIAAATLYGYVYLSEDGGDSWRKLDREFGEIRALTVSAV